MVVFASGDGGLRGMSKDLLMHLAGQSYWAVGFSSPEAFKGIADDSNGQPNYAGARDRLASLVGQAKQAMELPEPDADGDHRDVARANVVVAGAGDTALQAWHRRGRRDCADEFDDLTVPDSAVGRPGVQTTIRAACRPIRRSSGWARCAWQSSSPPTVRAGLHRRRLLGWTRPRAACTIESKNHSFGGGRRR